MFLKILKNSQACSFIKKETLELVLSFEFSKIFTNTYLEEHLWTSVSGFTLENHVEIESQIFTALTCLVYINIPVDSSVFFFFHDFLYIFVLFLMKINFERENYMENFGLFQNIVWILRLRQQIWSYGICRLKLSTYCVVLTTSKTDYNIRISKSD